jgi:hypothetical protein
MKRLFDKLSTLGGKKLVGVDRLGNKYFAIQEGTAGNVCKCDDNNSTNRFNQ